MIYGLALFRRTDSLETLPGKDFRTRKELAEKVVREAVTIPVGNPDEWYNVLAYLREHKDAVVKYNDGVQTMYIPYTRWMSARCMPHIRIAEVDTSKFWMIAEEFGTEEIRYFDLSDENQMIPTRC